MAKRKFTKLALPATDLISFMESKGLIVSDHGYAQRWLSYVGYYRLKIYMRPFENALKQFDGRTTFEQIIEVYDFDRKLRLLCLDANERIEVALRSQIINVMSFYGGPHFYYQEEFFETKEAVTSIRQLGEKGKHLSITHYKREYYEPYLPAIWCLTEASTLGQLSKLYADLNVKYRKEISKNFGFDESICVSWFKTITTLRNICAHHGRLWNAELLVNAPRKAKKYKIDLSDNKKLYSRLVVLMALLREIDPNKGRGWMHETVKLINNRPSLVDSTAMGFPVGWETHPLWSA